ncbi:MAG: zinc ribbon domain-containing protein [Proteobacteria bacterium]|nr:zinc ribbon domain-containing protein [Pseudomonadota bacterium]
MPFYDYDCPSCGAFTEFRPLADFEKPCPCPACGRKSARALTAPALGAGTAVAAASPAAGAPNAFRRHPGGCGCCAAPARRVATAV